MNGLRILSIISIAIEMFAAGAGAESPAGQLKRQITSSKSNAFAKIADWNVGGNVSILTSKGNTELLVRVATFRLKISDKETENFPIVAFKVPNSEIAWVGPKFKQYVLLNDSIMGFNGLVFPGYMGIGYTTFTKKVTPDMSVEEICNDYDNQSSPSTVAEMYSAIHYTNIFWSEFFVGLSSSSVSTGKLIDVRTDGSELAVKIRGFTAADNAELILGEYATKVGVLRAYQNGKAMVLMRANPSTFTSSKNSGPPGKINDWANDVNTSIITSLGPLSVPTRSATFRISNSKGGADALKIIAFKLADSGTVWVGPKFSKYALVNGEIVGFSAPNFLGVVSLGCSIYSDKAKKETTLDTVCERYERQHFPYKMEHFFKSVDFGTTLGAAFFPGKEMSIAVEGEPEKLIDAATDGTELTLKLGGLKQTDSAEIVFGVRTSNIGVFRIFVNGKGVPIGSVSAKKVKIAEQR